MMTQPTQLIERIVKRELEMFLTMPARHQHLCHEDSESFKQHRRARFICWSLRTLASYLQDLDTSHHAGINLMTVKYAHMEKLIPRHNDTALVDALLTALCRWEEECAECYPHFMAQGRAPFVNGGQAQLVPFEISLRGELESYSLQTLKLLWRDVLRLQQRGENLSKKTYQYLIEQWGLDSIEHLEEFMARHPASMSRKVARGANEVHASTHKTTAMKIPVH
ncbi:DUF4125 family protein [uncultured Desulfuromonas sp.]|uniref:DUF4125 family protein n=1 Tax=uncultured Desulfuromonas sp. TaxID=181013 RepID=UPI002AAB417A|nr:DUF4125 family protein [uncultured Desulfuromonas sp.]